VSDANYEFCSKPSLEWAIIKSEDFGWCARAFRVTQNDFGFRLEVGILVRLGRNVMTVGLT
jgi:hypothetical protein